MEENNVFEAAVSAEAPGKKRRRLPTIAIVAIVIGGLLTVLGTLIGIYAVNYFRTILYLESGSVDAASDCIISTKLTALMDPETASYLEAYEMMEDGRFEEAAEGFRALGDFREAADFALESDYRRAGKCAEAGDAETAIELYTYLSSMSYKDSAAKLTELSYQNSLASMNGFAEAGSVAEGDEEQYLKALEYIEKEDYAKAYSALKKISATSDVGQLMSQLADLIYIKAQSHYYNNDYISAMDSFMLIPEYERSRDYIVLCFTMGCHGTRSLSTPQIVGTLGYKDVFLPEEQVAELLAIFDFENAAEALLHQPRVAQIILQGTWVSEDGEFDLVIDSLGDCTSLNLPIKWEVLRDGGYYYIEEGEFRIYEETTTDYDVAFSLRMLSPDSLEFYNAGYDITLILNKE